MRRGDRYRGNDPCGYCGEKRVFHSMWAPPERRAKTRDHDFVETEREEVNDDE